MIHSKMAAIRTAIAVIAALFLTGCMSNDHGVERMAGAGLGGVAGGVLGSTAGNGKSGIAATVVGTMTELFLGSEIGASFDKLCAGHCQVNRIHSEISVNCRWLLYAISMA